MIDRTKLTELRSLLATAMVNRQGKFKLAPVSMDEDDGLLQLEIAIDEQYSEELGGCMEELGEFCQPTVAALVVAVLNELSELLDTAEKQVQRNETIW